MDERGKSSPCHQFYPDDVAYTPAKLAQKSFEESSVNKSFSCWEGNLGSASQIYDCSGGMYKFLEDVESWHTMSCRDLLALADATIRKGSVNGDGGRSSGGGGGATETQPYGWL